MLDTFIVVELPAIGGREDKETCKSCIDIGNREIVVCRIKFQDLGKRQVGELDGRNRCVLGYFFK